MHGAARAAATSVSADCCIPAGLRLGPVPGTFKLGKYLSDRREPGPKKKVLAIPTFAPCAHGERGAGGRVGGLPSGMDRVNPGSQEPPGTDSGSYCRLTRRTDFLPSAARRPARGGTDGVVFQLLGSVV
uniref:PR/SET domain 13 n=1 Tax=Rousettus aegyptiacus TaxID=9407 RepID=A0A7J8KEZ6_ROUAE|nr:PR/SET domain 13 [Rousettus aegyptiacus]